MTTTTTPEPQPREVPAGKILLSEYGDYDASQRAHRYELERIPTASRELEVCRMSAGFEPAGSAARWTNGYYAVLWSASDGTRHGQHTKTLSEALELAHEWRANDYERVERYRLAEKAAREELARTAFYAGRKWQHLIDA